MVASEYPGLMSVDLVKYTHRISLQRFATRLVNVSYITKAAAIYTILKL